MTYFTSTTSSLVILFSNYRIVQNPKEGLRFILGIHTLFIIDVDFKSLLLAFPCSFNYVVLGVHFFHLNASITLLPCNLIMFEHSSLVLRMDHTLICVI